MPDYLRITVDEVRKRMDAGENFVLIDTRNRTGMVRSDMKLPISTDNGMWSGLPVPSLIVPRREAKQQKRARRADS